MMDLSQAEQLGITVYANTLSLHFVDKSTPVLYARFVDKLTLVQNFAVPAVI